VDGDVTTVCHTGKTSGWKNGFMEFDLGGRKVVGQVNVTNRGGACGARICSNGCSRQANVCDACIGGAVGTTCGTLVTVGDVSCVSNMPGCLSSNQRCGVLASLGDADGVIDVVFDNECTGRYIQLTTPGRNTAMHFKEIAAYEGAGSMSPTPVPTPEATPITASATVSGEGNQFYMTGSNCVDGDVTTLCHTGQTPGWRNAYVELDFNSSQVVAQVKVTNREDNCRARICANGCTPQSNVCDACIGGAVGTTCGTLITVGDVSCVGNITGCLSNQQCGVLASLGDADGFIDLVFNATCTGRYLQLTTPGRNTAMHFKEIAAYGAA